ncbi:O-antigen ligase family protein [Fictibacillus barbaricus]|uniref:O-antigen ligase family protein n=1 Tax=Fictibacillus barbaricus TaxID=182136 RepID=A0ABS2ZH91_9BACL|nr:O-antigen ligase family protein [Fictibacillus barbaricus]MBN3546752.1 O-antigen ligase family protein [Fictibacillus barbaricus]GGB43573.1 hypothetical protein GCM10007199_06110 [Fictibacillus barbaricus]
MKTSSFDKWIDYLFYLYIFFIPFSVSEDFRAITGPIPASVLLTFIISLAFMIYYIRTTRKLPFVVNQDLSKNLLVVLICFFLPVLFSTISAVYNFLSIDAYPYSEYFKGDFPARIINFDLFFVFLISFVPLINRFKTERLHAYIKAYWIAVSFLLLIGFWQFLHLTVGIPMFDMQTRSYVHSVGGGAQLFDFRLTSFASEPSYMVPFVIDGFLIGALVFRSYKKYIIWSFLPALFILLFSFSLGGYLNFFLVFCGFLLIIFTTTNPYKGKVLKGLAVLIGLALVAALFNTGFILKLIGPVIGRLDTVFDMQEHERLFLLLMPFIWIFQHGQTFFQVLFGMGPGSFKYLNITQYFPDDLHKVYVTSNNFYIDVLYEHGLIGFILSIVLMVYFLWFFFKRRKEGKYAQVGFLITLHLSITSLYRADFTSPRFWMMFIILFILIHLLSLKKTKIE